MITDCKSLKHDPSGLQIQGPARKLYPAV